MQAKYLEAFNRSGYDGVIQTRDIIVIGTSAGGVDALQKIVSDLPNTISAAVFMVMHLPASRRSELPKILSRQTNMPVINPKSNADIQAGHIYVAPSDYHLVIERNKHIALWHGPKENNFRPSINPLFRSAADVYGNRVVGVILTGSLDDGVAGLAWVKRHGGVTVVQDPGDAKFPDLPTNALRHVHADYVMPVSNIADLLVELVNGSAPAHSHSERRR